MASNEHETFLGIKRTALMEVCVFLGLVAFGIASRIWLVDMPNFKPVAALVLFGGFFFRQRWVTIAALVALMVVSDLFLGVYQWTLALSVYGSLAIAGGLGMWVRRCSAASQLTMGWKQTCGFLVASLMMSTAFYVLTNGAVWAMGQWYPATWSGLTACYVAGLPFYRMTLLGDLFFTGSLVAVCWAVQSVVVGYRGLKYRANVDSNRVALDVA